MDRSVQEIMPDQAETIDSSLPEDLQGNQNSLQFASGFVDTSVPYP